MRCCIVVLGDVGRNPRMQYHALSLAQNSVCVDFIGYYGTAPHKKLLSHPLVTFRYLTPAPTLWPGIGLVVKLFWQIFSLFFALICVSRPDFLLVQNPPGLPALMVCFLVSKIRCFKFLIDWHNYTWSIFGLRWGKESFFVKLVKQYEVFFGQMSDGGLCVTNAMRQDLRFHHINAITFYDRPFDAFRSMGKDDQHRFLVKIGQSYPQFRDLSVTDRAVVNVSKVAIGRRCLVVTSTSWTPDENFDLLLGALRLYNEILVSGEVKRLPNLLVAVTGKGPLKSHYEQVFASLHLECVEIVTLWLNAEDYPKLLACADLGICLHYSSSGMDLPMKVVDMFGCGLPVLAISYDCIAELVESTKNGYLFDSAESL
ncbi:unnamed protein product, partial [Soboliphyme baturini]|uniref:Beta-1,4-mannosyltransferase n=1 Tax=Soboliphyme baturini TaxID=241478 RepID=A0A183J819_9BILA